MPNKKYEPTPQQRDRVRTLARHQISLDDICELEGFRSRKILLRCCRKELLEGRANGRLNICIARYKMAKSGKHPRATIAFLKRYARWHEGMEVDPLRGSGIQREEFISEIRLLKSSRPPDRDLTGLDPSTTVEFHDPWGGAQDPEEDGG